MKIESRPWKPQDLIDDLQEIIEGEPDSYLNPRHSTLCMARDYLKEYFAGIQEEGSASLERLTYWNKEYECWSYHCPSGDAAKRLAAYEDAGLTPAEVRSMRAEWISARQLADSLRARLEAEKNEPFTLEKLREMHGQPVWVILNPVDITPDGDYNLGYGIVDSEYECVKGLDYLLAFEDYGAWLAYHRKPEEVSE